MELYILRHGIAEEAAAGQSDSERALTPEGKKKLRSILESARGAGVSPSLILTSPLRRAVETAEIAADVLKFRDEPLKTKALVSEAQPKEAWEEIRLHKDEKQLLLASHEPLCSRLFGYLLGAPDLDVDFKKGALARIDFDRFAAEPRGLLRWLMIPKLSS